MYILSKHEIPQAWLSLVLLNNPTQNSNHTTHFASHRAYFRSLTSCKEFSSKDLGLDQTSLLTHSSPREIKLLLLYLQHTESIGPTILEKKKMRTWEPKFWRRPD